MKYILRGFVLVLMLGAVGCAHGKTGEVDPSDAVKLDRKLVREAVIFDPGTEEGAVIPDVSSPSLHAKMVEDKRDGNRIIEKHREWILEGEATLMDIPRREKH